ncbi:MAG: response regulator [Candidatus Marinimicrobia bacterium]|nr:response regulator [Candidatus Neomarinimicrobiota bacterium]
MIRESGLGTILIVDSDRSTLKILEKYLQQQNFQTLCAADGQLALKYISDGSVDLVLLDIEMPQMSGHEILEAIRRDHPAVELPVIMVTPRDEASDILRSFDLGANDHVVKPFIFPVLAARIKTQLVLRGAVARLRANGARPATHLEKKSPEIAHTQRSMAEEGRILVVDDNEDNRAIICRRLETKGYEAIPAESGEQALQMLEMDQYDLVILDIMMPGMDGTEVLQIIREKYSSSELPVVVASANTERDVMIEFLNNGANDFITKPIDAAVMNARVETLIAYRRSWNEIQESRDILDKIASDRTSELEKANAALKKEIKEHLELQAKLEISEAKYKSLFEDSRDVIYITQFDGTTLDMNESGLALFGYSRDELAQLNDRELYNDAGDRDNLFKNILKDGFLRDYEVSMRKKDGTPITCLITATLRKDSDGEAIGVQGILRDITEKRNLENQLLQAQKMEAMGHLTAGIAHDFNNVLAVIHGAQQLLAMKINGSGDGSYLSLISKAVKRGQSITNRMLTFSRKKEPDYQIVSIMAALDDTRGIARHSLPKTVSIDIEEFTGEDLIKADKEQLNLVLLNLVINASDALPDGGQVILGVHEASDEEVKKHTQDAGTGYLCVTVADNGEGMDQQTQENIFSPFFTTKEAGKGTGLGLSIVYTIVQNHQGWIEVDSRPGKGTTFTIGFPKIELNRPEIASSVDDLNLRSGQGQTILIVDDEPELVDMMTEILTKANYKTMSAANGKQALELYMKNMDRLDLIVADLDMPVMAGTEFIKKVGDVSPNIPIIVCSGYLEENEFESLNDQQVLAILIKPVNYNDLLEAIRKALIPPSAS